MKMRRLLLALLCSSAVSVLAQTTDELNNDGRNTDNVTTQSMGYHRRSYSPLKQITTSNVKRLVPIWKKPVAKSDG